MLRRRIKPVMLRRTKEQVAGELPPKQEQVLTLDLGPKHRKIYDTHMARERQKVLGLLGDWEKNRFQIFRSLTLLRQLSLHAGLVDESKIDVGAAKVDFLVEQLPELGGRRSQRVGVQPVHRFPRHPAEPIWTPSGSSYSYLDGSSSSRQRDAAIRDFKAGVNQVFLISLKAGGFGLNLTEADYCFVCDPWWNPAAEAQAIDRTHRIGQTRPVTVYRLVSEGTIEEKVVALQDAQARTVHRRRRRGRRLRIGHHRVRRARTVRLVSDARPLGVERGARGSVAEAVSGLGEVEFLGDGRHLLDRAR